MTEYLYSCNPITPIISWLWVRGQLWYIIFWVITILSCLKSNIHYINLSQNIPLCKNPEFCLEVPLTWCLSSFCLYYIMFHLSSLNSWYTIIYLWYNLCQFNDELWVCEFFKYPKLRYLKFSIILAFYSQKYFCCI